VMNIHPTLIPAFSGQGYFGNKCHEAVLKRGCRISGASTHMVNNHYDEGPIILQSVVPVLENDSVETLGARVFAEECKIYPESIKLFAEKRLEIVNNKVKILSPKI